MKKLLVGVTILVIAYALWYQFGRPPQHTLQEFTDYLTAQGLNVQVAVPAPGEKQLLDTFKADMANLQKSLGAEPDTSQQPLEVEAYDIGAIKDVHIEHYATEALAKKIYASNITNEKRDRANHQGSREDYLETEYLLAGTFVVTIYHWDVPVSHNINLSARRPLQLPPEELLKLRTALTAWHE